MNILNFSKNILKCLGQNLKKENLSLEINSSYDLQLHGLEYF